MAPIAVGDLITQQLYLTSEDMCMYKKPSGCWTFK